MPDRSPPSRRLHALQEQNRRLGESWRRSAWPEPAEDGAGTPRYLIDTYPATLADAPDRLAALAGDIGWIGPRFVRSGSTPHFRRSTGGRRFLGPAQQLRSVVAAQAPSLRPPFPVEQPGYVLRRLCLQALRFGMGALFADLKTVCGPWPTRGRSHGGPPARNIPARVGARQPRRPRPRLWRRCPTGASSPVQATEGSGFGTSTSPNRPPRSANTTTGSLPGGPA